MKQKIFVVIFSATVGLLTGCEGYDVLATVQAPGTDMPDDTDTPTTPDSTADGDTATQTELDSSPTGDSAQVTDNGIYQWRICEATRVTGFDKVDPAMNPTPVLTAPLRIPGTDQFVTMYTESELDFLFYTSVDTFPSASVQTHYNIYSPEGDSVYAQTLANGKTAYVRRAIDSSSAEYLLVVSDLQENGVQAEIPLPGNDLSRLPQILPATTDFLVLGQLESSFTFGAGTDREVILAPGEGRLIQNYMARFSDAGEFLEADVIDLPFLITDAEQMESSAGILVAGLMNDADTVSAIAAAQLAAEMFADGASNSPTAITWASHNVTTATQIHSIEYPAVDLVADGQAGFYMFLKWLPSDTLAIYNSDQISRNISPDTVSEAIIHFKGAAETIEYTNDWAFHYNRAVGQDDWAALTPMMETYDANTLFLAGTVSDDFLAKAMADSRTVIGSDVTAGSTVLISLMSGQDAEEPYFDAIRAIPSQLQIHGLTRAHNDDADGNDDIVLSATYATPVEFKSPVLTPEGNVTTVATTSEAVLLLNICDIQTR